MFYTWKHLKEELQLVCTCGYENPRIYELGAKKTSIMEMATKNILRLFKRTFKIVEQVILQFLGIWSCFRDIATRRTKEKREVRHLGYSRICKIYVTTGSRNFFFFNQTLLWACNLIFYSNLNFDVLTIILVMFGRILAALDVVLYGLSLLWRHVNDVKLNPRWRTVWLFLIEIFRKQNKIRRKCKLTKQI